MSTTTIQKGAVISIRSPEDANIIVLHKDGSINNDRVSVGRLNSEKHYHYILQTGDLIIRENKCDKTSQRKVTIESVTVTLSGDRYRATFTDVCTTDEITSKAIRLLNDPPQRSLNHLSSMALLASGKFASLLTHGVIPIVQGHPIDFLIDAPGILFEKLDKDDKANVFNLSSNIYSIATITDGEIVNDTFINARDLQTLSYSKNNNYLLISRSLRHGMRLTISSHSSDNLEAAKVWFENIISDTGFQVRKNKTKRGDLFVVLPKLSQIADDLCKTVS